MQPLRVFIVDDSRPFRLIASLVVETFPGVKVVGLAECAEDAFALIAQTTPDVVLMDLSLPGMSGIEATRRLKESACSNAPLVVIVTAYDEPAYREAAASARADGFLAKDGFNESARVLLEQLAGRCLQRQS